MPRKRDVPVRPINPDPKYRDALVTKFTNVTMLNGKKSVAEHIIYGAFERIEQRTGEDPVRLFKKAVDNVRPSLEVKSRRVGGSNYQVPIEVRPERRTALALRWLVGFARQRGETSMVERMAGELMDAAQNRGNAVRKKDETHRMAEANKAFAHYRW